jgi:hypothetical protein
VWKYKGARTSSVQLAQLPSRTLRLLRRIGTNTPWTGATKTSIRKCWARLAFVLDSPWDSVASLSAKEAILAIQHTYPALEWIRVEWRQVGEWTDMLDPLTHLRTPSTLAAERRLEALFETLDGMTREELDNWRLVPPAARGDTTPSREQVPHSHGLKHRTRRRQAESRQAESPAPPA